MSIQQRILQNKALKQLRKDYVFPFEKMTRKEASELVPEPPAAQATRQVFHEISNPEDVIDYTATFSTKQVLTSALARNRQILGYPMLTRNGVVSAINLHHANLVIQWATEYNNKVRELLPPALLELVASVPELIKKQCQPSYTKYHENLGQFVERANIPLDTLVLYLLEVHENTSQVIRIACRKWNELSVAGQTNFVQGCIRKLVKDKQSAHQFCQLVNQVKPDLLVVNTYSLDQLAAMMVENGHQNVAMNILEIIVVTRGYEPLRETWNVFCETADPQNDRIGHFKLVFASHLPLVSEMKFLFRLMNHVEQLDNFVLLAASDTLEKFQGELFKKAQLLAEGSPTAESKMVISLLVRHYQSRGICLQEETLKKVGH